MSRLRAILLVLIVCAVGACESTTAPAVRDEAAVAYPGFEAISLFGEELERSVISAERRRVLEGDLAAARRALADRPGDVDSHIWVGRRLGYLGRYREAVDVLTAAHARFPQDYRVLRHRGHRNITLRRLDAAVEDLSQAAGLARGKRDAVEADGAPNEWGIPRSTDQSNIYYHLGLGHYLRGEWAEAERVFVECLEFAAVNDDMLVATVYWLSNSAARARGVGAGMEQARRVHAEMSVIENFAYHRVLMSRAAGTSEELLVEIEMESGVGSTEWVSAAYGVSVSQEMSGDLAGAQELRERILETGNWAAFGYIAAEADLARESVEVGEALTPAPLPGGEEAE